MIIAVFIAIGTFIYTIYLMYKQKRLEYSLIILSCFALALGFEACFRRYFKWHPFEPFVHSFFISFIYYPNLGFHYLLLLEPDDLL